ncbi:MAG: hypothetical protein HGA45_06765 [Chloroflexales bacterium]|nr:hypothetical protein [Chloroflexales bacterium]
MDAGVPAVLAMQDNVLMTTVQGFMPAFFKALLADNGKLDRAMAAGRAAIARAEERWKPVLYTRLRRGLLWYESGFLSGGDGDVGWKALQSSIADTQCLPILGGGLV